MTIDTSSLIALIAAAFSVIVLTKFVLASYSAPIRSA
jgi:hypothetical protein